jgi:Helix-destabilising protein
MSIMIEIASTDIKSRSGTSARTGNAYSMREQIGYLHKCDIYPERIKITLEDNQLPYAIGTYVLAPASFYVDKFDAIAVRPVLIARPIEITKPLRSFSDASAVSK